MNVQQVNNTNFGAKLIPCIQGGLKNENLLKIFEEKTKLYPNYGLLQDKISYSGKDTFYLLNKNGNKVMATKAPHSCYSYSCIEDMADRFVEIFNFLIKDIV